ncbi:ABC transporter substrate-binding protein [Saccharopolyspora griseoalba]|uniref:ABC transporter substrate-binding protein n=1 Tax=Saccharopolyspora griseoalba TaxID=1431848 RepID=A0ABW2LQB8_9PSEU
MRRGLPRVLGVLLAAVTAAGLLSGCAPQARDDALVVWSLESQTDRVRTTERIAARYTAETGVPVRVVAVDENQFAQMVMSAAAADDLPDVIGALPLSATWQMAGNDLLDTRANQEILDELGAQTFSRRALSLTARGGQRLAIPSDAWAQILVYRKDLFAEAGLPVPDSYAEIERAARRLNRDGMAGISMSTQANDTATGQAFEALALANGCRLVDRSGRITLDSPQCRETFRFVRELTTRYSTPGAQDVDSTRATYFAGRSAMLVWSTFLLDELGGLRDDAMPACPRCQGDPGFLARNTGIVGAIRGPHAEEPAQYGELTSWTVPVGAQHERAKDFVRFMMGERGYPDWLGMATEGKLPARKGTRQDPELFTRAWEMAPAGVDTKRRLNEIYPPETIAELRDGADQFRRWGFEQQQGVLIGATLGEMPVPRAVNSMLSGADPGEAAAEAADEIRSILTSLN